ncbi:MAG TPA: ABC transporter permease [Opitutales bacterium]|nr:ABC transporter permease [Opitutales bacterium]
MAVSHFQIAFRFLWAKKRAMLMSIGGIALGVAFFILTQAQTSGFEQFYIRTILGTSGAIQIRDRFQDTLRTMELAEEGKPSFRIAHRESRQYIPGIAEPDEVGNALLQFENVSGVSAIVGGSVRLRTTANEATVYTFGIDLDAHLRVSSLGDQILFGNLETFRNSPQGVLVGSTLARRMRLRLGDSFFIDTPDQTRPYRVAAIYETGVREIDEARVYIHLPEARSLLKRPHGASFLQVNLWEPDRAEADAERMEEVTGHFAYSWQEREQAWLEVFRALRVSSGLTVAAIIVISGLGMFNTLAMIVMEKTREIAILRSVGFEQRDIVRIFLWQGALALGIGVFGGWILGALFTYGVSRIPIRIRGIFSTDSFVVNWSIDHYLLAAGITTVVVILATLLPARRAARLEPADVIRNVAQ